MLSGFINEIPKSRVNIRLDLASNHSQEQHELPLKLLVLGDFSHRQPNKALATRQRLAINHDNFNAVLAAIKPQVDIQVQDCIHPKNKTMPIKLTMQKLADFHPDEFVTQVPALQKLLAMRHLLKDLSNNLASNACLREAVTSLLQDKTTAQQFCQQLKQTKTTRDLTN